MEYEVEFCTHGGHPFSRTKVVAEDDEQAIQRARVRLHCGIGGFYVIRRDGQVVHIEWIRERSVSAGKAPVHYWERIHACVEQSLKTADLEERRFLMLLAAKFLDCRPERARTTPRAYSIILTGRHETPVGETELEAENDGKAFDLASILAEACTPKCVRFEVWRGQALLRTGARPFRCPSSGQLCERSQQQIVMGEIALHEGCNSIAESQELLKEVDKWVRRSMYDA